MSGIYIKGMEMPENCDDCDLMTVEGEYGEPTCPFGRIIRCASERHPDCPLIRVPPHGRTVDADALPYIRLYKDNWIKGTGREAPAVWKEDVDSAPTVIPADHFRDATKMMAEEGEG